MIFTGHDLLKGFEGEIRDKSTGKHIAYRDGGGVLTIGWGHTGPDVKVGKTITDAEAKVLLDKDIAWASKCVNETLMGYPLTQNQFDALVSLCYNIGPDPKKGFPSSTVVKRIKNGDYKGAAEALTWWNKDNGKVVDGLVKRRAKEKALFLTPDTPSTVVNEREAKIRALVEDFVKALMEI